MAASRIRQACARESDDAGYSDNGKCSKHDVPFTVRSADNHIILYQAIANIAQLREPISIMGHREPEVRSSRSSDGRSGPERPVCVRRVPDQRGRFLPAQSTTPTIGVSAATFEPAGRRAARSELKPAGLV